MSNGGGEQSPPRCLSINFSWNKSQQRAGMVHAIYDAKMQRCEKKAETNGDAKEHIKSEEENND